MNRPTNRQINRHDEAKQTPPFGDFLRARITSVILLMAMAGCGGAVGAVNGHGGAGQAPSPVRILVDSIHAHNNLAPLPDAASYDYHPYTTYERSFSYLKSRGAEVSEIRSGRIDAAALRGQPMLFINLVTADPQRPSFGLKGPGGLYNVFDYLTRDLNIFATDDLSGEAKVLVFGHGNRRLPDAPLQALVSHLKQGNVAVVLNPDTTGKGIAAQLEAILGRPDAQADADTLTLQWPGGGRLIQIIDRQRISNETIPNFKTIRDAAQRRRLALLRRLL